MAFSQTSRFQKVDDSTSPKWTLMRNTELHGFLETKAATSSSAGGLRRASALSRHRTRSNSSERIRTSAWQMRYRHSGPYVPTRTRMCPPCKTGSS
eukprot:867253-Alexandrium_andersonii.AAC.1